MRELLRCRRIRPGLNRIRASERFGAHHSNVASLRSLNVEVAPQLQRDLQLGGQLVVVRADADARLRCLRLAFQRQGQDLARLLVELGVQVLDVVVLALALALRELVQPLAEIAAVVDRDVLGRPLALAGLDGVEQPFLPDLVLTDGMVDLGLDGLGVVHGLPSSQGQDGFRRWYLFCPGRRCDTIDIGHPSALSRIRSPGQRAGQSLAARRAA